MKKQNSRGQALIETTLVIPLVFLLMLNVVNFGGFFYATINVANAARAGADYLMMRGASVGQVQPTSTQVTTLIRNDLAMLPNGAGATITVCTNGNGSIKYPGTCLATSSDPQPGSSVLGTVNVTYTYTPYVQFWDFSRLGVHLTLPRTTIHRAASARMLQ